jgi:hypothetical protein
MEYCLVKVQDVSLWHGIKLSTGTLLSQHIMSGDSSVSMVLGYGLDNWDSRVQFPAGAGNFSLHHCNQNGSGAHPASYPMDMRDTFPGGKAARA